MPGRTLEESASLRAEAVRRAFGLQVMTRLGFSTRFAILACAGIALSAVVSGWLVYRFTAKTVTGNVAAQLQGLAAATAHLINSQGQEDLSGDTPRQIPNEEARRRLLKPIEAVLQSIRCHGVVPGVLAYRKPPGFAGNHELELVVYAGDPSGRHPYPGKRSLAALHHLQALRGDSAQTGVYSDFDGTWITATAPIRHAQGEVVGLVQADAPAHVASRVARQSLAVIAAASVLCALLVLLPAFLWGHFTDRRLDGLARALEAAAEGKLKRYPNLDRKSSLGRVIAQFNHLVDRLKAFHHDTDIKIRALASEGQQARRCGQSQMEFLADVSHEMRNTVNGVIGLNQILLDTPLSPEQHDLARTVHQTSRSLLGLLNDIMDYSKIESGGLSFAELTFDLRAVVESTLETFAPQAQRKGLELVGWVDDSVPCPLRGDPGRIRQVLSNLLSNAIKYTDSGEVMLAVLAADVTDRDVLLNVNVRDTGIGVAEEAGPHLFQISSHIHNQASRQSGGTGLGLAISRKIVETLHGTIGFESCVGHGSTFWFTMRLSRPAVAEPLPRLDPDAAHGLRVLVVDDNPTFLNVISQLLSSLGARHETVADGVDALRYLHRDVAAGVPHTLLLADAHLEGMDALTLARMVQEDPKIAPTKIALLTRMSDRKDSTEFRQRRIWACLHKPIRRSELFECLSKLIQRPAAQAPPEAPESNQLQPESLGPRSILPMPPPEGLPLTKSLRILLAEDDRLNQRLTRHLLNRLGCNLEIVADGRQAVHAVRSGNFDILLMDCFMPELDGYEAARVIRQEFPPQEPPASEPRRPYIIALTARALDGDREKCLAAGMDDYLSKPVEPEALRAALRRAQAHLEGRARAA